MSFSSHMFSAAIVAVLFLSVSRTNAQTEFPYNPACMLTTDSCSAWVLKDVAVHLPEYPGCELGLQYRTRSCPGGPGELPTEEIIVESIFWATPDSLTDSTAECFALHDTYINKPTNLQGDFLKHLFQEVVVTRLGTKFDDDYIQDSVQAVLHPGDPGFQFSYLHRLCGFGKKTYRVINGLCMAAITKPDVPFSGGFGRAEGGERKGSSVSSDLPHSARNYMRVRYVPCADISQIPCCVQLIQFCRDNVAGKTQMQILGTLVGPTFQCALSVPITNLEPGEKTTGCTDYCLDYGPEYGTKKAGESEGPSLSGPVEVKVIPRVEGAGNGDVGSTNR